MIDRPSLPIVIIGGGGHASVLAEILLTQGRDILAIISPEDISQRSVFKGIKHFKNDEDILVFSIDEILLVNGIGMMPKSSFKRKINESFLSLGYRFETVIADSAFVSPYALVGTGAQILNKAIVQTGAVIGNHSIINTGAIVEHDSQIGSYNHIAPGSTICGGVKTYTDVFIGVGSNIIQNIEVGSGAVVGAGVTLLHDLKPNLVCYRKQNYEKN